MSGVTLVLNGQPDERSKLLVDSLEDSASSDGEDTLSPTSSEETLCTNSFKSTPFPWRAVAVILLLNAVQPIAFELVFPFISALSLHTTLFLSHLTSIFLDQMILEIVVVDDPERVGFYSGVIESLFAVMSFVFGKISSFEIGRAHV